jgi:hypothetical protein
MWNNESERPELMRNTCRSLLILALVAVAANLAACASSEPSTTQAPPEIPEKKPSTTAATGAQEGAGGGGGGGGGQSGSGEAGSGGERDNSAGDTGDAAAGQSVGEPPAGSPTTGSEAAAALDKKLDGALEEFDQKMREEMQRLAEETAAAERTADNADVDGDAPSEMSGGTGEAGGEEEEGGDSGGSVGGSGPGGSGSDRIPPDVGDGSDDDIVARQLREAAIAEEDPELRKKLWDEYRRYKASLGGSSKDS